MQRFPIQPMLFRYLVAGALAWGWGGCRSEWAAAQVAVQLPTFQVFSVDTSVMVPDGGSLRLGSVGRGSEGLTARGVPLLGSAPLLGRPFSNRGSGRAIGSSSVSVHTQIISMSEQEAAVLAEGNRRLAERPFATPADVRRRAEFLTRHRGQAGNPATSRR